MLHAGLEENSSSPANLSHCHPGSTCTLRCLIHLAWGLLKQLGLRLLYCSFFVKFPCWLSYKWEYLFRRWLEKSKWWTMQPGRCRVRVRTPPARERTRGLVHASYGNGKNDLGVSDASLQKKKKESALLLSQCHCIWAHVSESTHYVELVVMSQIHVTILPPHLFYLLFVQQNLHRFIRCFAPSGSHRVEPVEGRGCGSSFALQD